MAARRRLDAELVRRRVVASRVEARSAIEAGLVVVAGRPALKPSTLVGTDEPLELRGAPRRFVSRGGEKLDAALAGFGIDVAGRDALDAGASTGGFTDVLLARGAARVLAVDVGYGQLAWSLRKDPRITVFERTNVRSLTPDVLPFEPSVVVADLSFISLRLVVRALAAVTAPRGDLVLLVKPQFEAGPEQLERGGVVRDPTVWRAAVVGVAAASRQVGLAPERVLASPLPGPAGNVEFLLWVRRVDAPGALDDDAVDAAIRHGQLIGSRR